MKQEVEYFDKPGKDNTERCLEIVRSAISEGYRTVVTATTGGETGLMFARALQGTDVDLVVVTHNVGFGKPNEDDCPAEAREELTRLGAKVYTGTILTRSIDYGIMKKHQGVSPSYVVAETLRMFGQGLKVAVEISSEACDAGLIEEGTDIISVAGTGRGADTVIVVEPHASHRFMETRIKKILAKPIT